MSEKPTFFPESELPESRVETKPSMDDFRQVVEGIDNSLAQGRRRHEKLGDTRNETKQFFIEEETNPDLQDLAKILMTAPLAAPIDQGLNERRARKKSLKLTDEEIDKERDISARITPVLVEYNHLVRDFVANNAGTLERGEFTEWLAEAGRDERWAKKIVAGVAADVAFEDFLHRLPEVDDVETTTNAQDVLGIDLIAHLHDGTAVPIDVKSGKQQPEDGVGRAHHSIKIGVPTEAVDEWHIIPRYAGTLRNRFRQAAKLSK